MRKIMDVAVWVPLGLVVLWSSYRLVLVLKRQWRDRRSRSDAGSQLPLVAALLLALCSARAATNLIPANTVLVASGDSQLAAGSTLFFALTNASTCVGYGATGWIVYTNAAHSGDGLTDIDNRYTNEVRVYTNNYPARTLVKLLNGGANSDLYTTTNRWLTNVLAMSNMIVRAQADHFLVAHLNLLPRGGYVGGVSPIGWSNENYRINWTNYNAWAASANNPADYKLDWASLVPPSTLGDTNYWNEESPNELHITLWANRMSSTNAALMFSTNTTPLVILSTSLRYRTSIYGRASFR